MQISRRDFLKWSLAAAIAMKLEFDTDVFNTVLASETDPPIIWLNGASCTGCTISTLNVINPTTIDNLLFNKVSIKFNNTIMGASGESALDALSNAARKYNKQYILVIEGAIPTASNGNYCIIGEDQGAPITMMDAVRTYAPTAKYIIAAGTCASFGGIAKQSVNTACQSALTFLSGVSGVNTNSIINLPGCPVHPTLLIQVIIDILLTGPPTLNGTFTMPAGNTTDPKFLINTPAKYFDATNNFGRYMHNQDVCERESLTRATQIGQYGCYSNMACGGRYIFENICPTKKWNGGQNWCIGSNHPCIGCTSSTFPRNPLNVYCNTTSPR